ncbi:MAG: response regulator transcription factor [Chloroflexi bacterium]|nr:response regulator transcription factor [Chloroflexota bacterium]
MGTSRSNDPNPGPQSAVHSAQSAGALSTAHVQPSTQQGCSPAAGRPIRVAAVDPHPMMREGLRLVLAQAQDIQLVGLAEDGAGALRLVEEARPDVLILELALPDVGGIALVQQVHASHPEVALLVLTAYAEVSHLAPLLQLDTRGYLAKTASAEALVATVHAAREGLTVLAAEATRTAAGSEAARAVFQRDRSPLTPREQEVLPLLTAGRHNDEIAERLCTTVKTAEFHVSNVLRKLGVRSRSALVANAGHRRASFPESLENSGAPPPVQSGRRHTTALPTRARPRTEAKAGSTGRGERVLRRGDVHHGDTESRSHGVLSNVLRGD